MENEQKKEYTKPQVTVVEFECRRSLLQECSGECDDNVIDTDWIKQ